MKYLLLTLLLFYIFSCKSDSTEVPQVNDSPVIPDTLAMQDIPAPTRSEQILSLFKEHPEFMATGFDYPVGKPNAKNYYNAQGFVGGAHLGDDWNAVTGGNSDLGDPVYAVANGYVHFAEDWGGGWGNIIRVWHQTHDSLMVESFYAHCDTILVEVGDFVVKGEQIGTIGDAHGSYLAHLHFEIRSDVDLPVGGGYSSDKTGYLDPTAFIKDNR